MISSRTSLDSLDKSFSKNMPRSKTQTEPETCLVPLSLQEQIRRDELQADQRAAEARRKATEETMRMERALARIAAQSAELRYALSFHGSGQVFARGSGDWKKLVRSQHGRLTPDYPPGRGFSMRLPGALRNRSSPKSTIK